MTIPNKPMSLQLNKDQVRALNAELFAKFDPTKLEHMSKTSFYAPSSDSSRYFDEPSLKRSYKPRSPSTPKAESSSPKKQTQVFKASDTTDSNPLQFSPSEKRFFSRLYQKPLPNPPKNLTLKSALDAISISNPKTRNEMLTLVKAKAKKSRGLLTIDDTSVSSLSISNDGTDSPSKKHDRLTELIAKKTDLRAENYELNLLLDKEIKELRASLKPGIFRSYMVKTDYSKADFDKLIKRSEEDLTKTNDSSSSTPQRLSRGASTTSRPRWR